MGIGPQVGVQRAGGGRVQGPHRGERGALLGDQRLELWRALDPGLDLSAPVGRERAVGKRRQLAELRIAQLSILTGHPRTSRP